MERKASILGIIIVVASTCGCSSEDAAAPPGGAAFSLTSPAVTSGQALPDDYTCNGKEFAAGNNPALSWTGGPAATKSYAIVFRDMSIFELNDPATLNRAFHWVIWDIPASIHAIPTGMGDAEFPPEVAGARQWANRNQFGFFPPCPNSDPAADPALKKTDRYALTLYALDQPILAYPAADPAVTNYTRTIFGQIDSAAIAKTDLLFTSDAASTAPPPMVDPATIKYPSARP